MSKTFYVGNKVVSGWGALFAILGLLVLAIFIEPFLLFWLGYFSGWIAKLIIGKYIVAGFALLGITLPLDSIPLFAGVLAWIGSFFKNSSFKANTNNN